MSDQEQNEVLDLQFPDYSSRSRRPRKTMYKAGQINTVTIDVDGQEVTSYVAFESARLIGASYREQTTNSGREMLVVNVGIILDNLQVGLVDEDNNRHPHPLLSQERYKRYREYPDPNTGETVKVPHRVNAQQWMAREHVERFDALANHLYENHEFRIITNPRNPEGSQRQTQDKAQVRPIDNIEDLDDKTTYGAPVNGFEVSVNENYSDGFRSFYQGLTEQQQRIESAFSETDPELREQMVKQLRDARNVHFVGGAYYNEEQNQWFARVVDVGIVIVDGNTFPFYPVRGTKLDSRKLLSEPTTQGNGSSSQPLALTAPTAEQVADF